MPREWSQGFYFVLHRSLSYWLGTRLVHSIRNSFIVESSAGGAHVYPVLSDLR